MAKSKGFTEPDVRDDLSGLDFARKLVVLARAAGHLQTTLEQVQWKTTLLSPHLSAMSADEFLSKGLMEMEAQINRLASDKQNRLVFLGSVDSSGVVSCGVESVSKSSPFGGLTGASNMIVIETSMVYSADAPLVICGPGAGAAATAQGILSDLFA